MHKHLLVQVDSAINPGNSGGPVLQEDRVVGVAFESIALQRMGYIIPTPIIGRFLKDIKDGHYDGCPDLGFVYSIGALHNQGTADFYGVERGQQGVKVESILKGNSLGKSLQLGDLVVAIDGNPIAVDGKIEAAGERVEFEALADLKLLGETITYSIIRNRRRYQIKTLVEKSKGFYPGNRYENQPSLSHFWWNCFYAFVEKLFG